jgi:hypothetical protein
LARSWAISGVSDRTREAVTAAADAAGMPVGAWVEQALIKALTEGLEAGVSIEEIEARVRAAVAQELEPVRQALAHLEAAAPVPTAADSGSPIGLLRERRLRQRRPGRRA